MEEEKERLIEEETKKNEEEKEKTQKSSSSNNVFRWILRKNQSMLRMVRPLTVTMCAGNLTLLSAAERAVNVSGRTNIWSKNQRIRIPVRSSTEWLYASFEYPTTYKYEF